MKLAVICLALVVLVPSNLLARPTTQELVARYAALHPNKGDAEECQELQVEGKDVSESSPLNAVIDPRLKWPDNTAYYSIVESGYTAQQIQWIEAGIAELQRLTQVNGQPCIRILPRTTQTDYISVENYSGCSSYVGRIGGRQRMSLFNSATSSCITRQGIILHEFLHALGFHHEQTRTDRDEKVIINWENIQPGTEHNFVKYGENVITLLGTPYDYGSVMHYGAYDFAIDRSIPTIITLDENAEIGQRVTLSALDIERVQIHYGCLNAADSIYFKHLAQ